MNNTQSLIKTDLVSRIAWLYFIKGYTQHEISEMLDVSRMQVQRSISKSRKTGLVRIQITDPLTSCFEKEDELKDRFSLSDAIVSPTPQDKSKLKEALGEVAAGYLLRRFRDNQVIGVGWGTTLHEITQFLCRRTLTDSHVVSLIGGWTKRADGNPYEVAWKLADVVVVCTGAMAAVSQGLEYVERGGTVLFFAPTEPGKTLPVSVNDFLFGEVTVTSSYSGSREDATIALKLIRTRRVRVREMITHRLGLAETGKGFDLVADPKDSIKVIIEPQS